MSNTELPTTNTKRPIPNSQQPTNNQYQPPTYTQFPIPNSQFPIPNSQRLHQMSNTKLPHQTPNFNNQCPNCPMPKLPNAQTAQCQATYIQRPTSNLKSNDLLLHLITKVSKTISLISATIT